MTARSFYLEMSARGFDFSEPGAARKLYSEADNAEIYRAVSLIETHRQDLEAILRARHTDLKAIREEGRG